MLSLNSIQPIKWGLIILFIFFGVFGTWACFAPLKSAAVSQGAIVLYSKNKIIQHLEGGIIEKISIKEGDFVEKGQQLLILNKTYAQEALLLGVLRYSHKSLHKVLAYAKTTVRKKRKHWYVRCQAVNIIANSVIHPKSFDNIINMYTDENDPEVKRSLLKLLCQLDSEKQLKILNTAIYDPYFKIANLSKMLISLRQDKNLAIDTISYIFRDNSEHKLADNFYKLGVIRYHNDIDVLKHLEDSLSQALIPSYAKYLGIKRKSILEQLQVDKQLHLKIAGTKGHE